MGERQSVDLVYIWQNNCEKRLSVRSGIIGVTQFVEFLRFGVSPGTFSEEIILWLMIGILDVCSC